MRLESPWWFVSADRMGASTLAERPPIVDVFLGAIGAGYHRLGQAEVRPPAWPFALDGVVAVCCRHGAAAMGRGHRENQGERHRYRGGFRFIGEYVG